MSGPLEGVRILDLTQVQAGPSSTQLLAFLGADVIKIEEPGKGDRTRVEMAHRKDMDSFYYLVFNANKRSLCLNLKKPEGVEIFHRLASISDAVVENYGPGRMESFGLGQESLRKRHPHLVFASIKGFGSYGPYAGYKSYENVAQAMGGAMSTNGYPDRPPTWVSPGVGDSGTGLHCAIGLLAALRQRDKTGVGAYVEVAMQDAIVNLMRVRMVETLPAGNPVKRTGNRVWGGPSLVYPCAPGGPDDYVTITIAGDAWDSILAVVGRADLIGDERYATSEARSQRLNDVETLISTWTATRTKREVMATMAELGIPCGAVQDTTELLSDPHLRAREMVIDLNDPKRGTYQVLGCPIKVSTHKVAVTPPPLLGEDTEQVLSTLLGFTSEQVQRLGTNGVV
ncbi:MAG: formyl-CoA transferase [SAR202 cluster bacterium]|nr:formyl-CoA transferase [SAR202 cluster bacterium]